MEKSQIIEGIRKELDKEFGDGTIMRLGENKYMDVETFSTGSLALDIALGGGYPKGRAIEIYGQESAGKSTLALHAVAQIQKKGGIAAYIDAEHALDPVYARKIGVNTDELWVAQPDSGEQALAIAEELVKSGAVDLIIVDSVAALVPQAELDGDMGDSHMGLQARLMSQALRKLAAIMAKNKTTVIFINQIRMKIGVMFGNPETVPGGNALKFYSSVRLDVRKIDTIKEGDNTIGTKVRIKVVKNKIAPPFRKVETNMYFDGGIRRDAELCDLGIEKGIVKRAGAWYSYKDIKASGRGAFMDMLSSHSETLAALENEIVSGNREDA